jgi:hypothetical protein
VKDNGRVMLSAPTRSTLAMAPRAVAGLAGFAASGVAADERVLAGVSVLGLIIGLLPLGRTISEDQVLQ